MYVCRCFESGCGFYRREEKCLGFPFIRSCAVHIILYHQYKDEQKKKNIIIII